MKGDLHCKCDRHDAGRGGKTPIGGSGSDNPELSRHRIRQKTPGIWSPNTEMTSHGWDHHTPSLIGMRAATSFRPEPRDQF
jgi:hypothetical protein